jgi:hypothetical protein
MRAQPPVKAGLYRLGSVILKISAVVATAALIIWLFAPDSWASGKSAAVAALFALPAGLIVYGLTRFAAWTTDSK